MSATNAPVREISDTWSTARNGMRFTYERLASGEFTCQVVRAEDGHVIVARHVVRDENLLVDLRARWGGR